MKSGKLTVGTAFLVIGVLLLGRTAGWFPAFSWAHLLRFWPVIFIALGLELIFPKGILSLLAPLSIVIAVIFALSGPAALPDKLEWHSLPTRTITAPSATPEAELILNDMPAIRIELLGSSGLPGNQVLAADQMGLMRTTQVVSIQGRNHFSLTARSRWSTGIKPLKITLPTYPIWASTINAGILSGHMDLTELKWSNLTVNSGITNLEISLADPQADQTLHFRTGIANLVLHMPRGINLQVISNSPFPLRQLTNAQFTRLGKRYTAPGFDPTQPSIEIVIDAGISSVEVVWQGLI